MRVPVATYRFQFNRDFTLGDARRLLAYLKDLGISDVYASPLFLAAPESSHGYDVCDYNQINPAIGARADLEKVAAELQSIGMGLLLDVVPNHMGVHPSNCWWYDVLKHGRKSKFAHYFDINWNPATLGLQGKVLLPILAYPYSNVLDRGELKLEIDGDSVYLAYFDHKFPLSPESREKFELRDGHDSRTKSLVPEINSRHSDPARTNDLHSLIDMQHYRLAWWRVGSYEINYRRFFDVTGLVSVRVEDDEVFRASHELVLDLLRTGIATGIRVDHPDGMRDPRKYFNDLQKAANSRIYVVAEKILSAAEPLPETWPIDGTTGYDYLNCLNGLFIQSENEAAFNEIYKLFLYQGSEMPPQASPLSPRRGEEATAGFEGGKLSSPSPLNGERVGVRGKADLTTFPPPYAEIAYRSKQEVLHRLFPAEVNALTRRLKHIASQTRFGADLVQPDLREALIDFIAAFPVYRNYVDDQSETISPTEQEYIQQALQKAKEQTRLKETLSLDFLARVLSLECYPDFSPDLRAEARDFAVRFQQLSGPATAKGLEDTAFYRYNRFVSLNEVGGEPGRFGISVEEFHQHNSHKAEKWPHSLLATATHDTKRGEDVRARLNVLSEMPAEWKQSVIHWRDLNATLKTNRAPTANDEYLLYQMLVGTWTPNADRAHYTKRIQEYMLKAIREAKTETSWSDPNEPYENATTEFIGRILDSPKFTHALTAFAEGIAFFGAFNSLAQVLLKGCSPGIPDFYQGTELWDLSMVDPDNRRSIDYAVRQTLLRSLPKKSAAELLADWQSGAAKLFTTISVLKARNQYREIFEGQYQPIPVTGEQKNHVIAFIRTGRSGRIIAATPRFVRTLTGGKPAYPKPGLWGDTTLNLRDSGHFRNLITGEEHHSLSAADLFKTFPVALLLTLN